MKSIAKLTLEHKQDKEGQHKTDKKILLSFGVAFSFTTEFSDCRFSAVFFFNWDPLLTKLGRHYTAGRCKREEKVKSIQCN